MATTVKLPDALDLSAMDGGICADTIGGWLWYCDEHDTHGNADSEGEAQAVADAHQRYVCKGMRHDDRCTQIVWQPSEHRQA